MNVTGSVIRDAPNNAIEITGGQFAVTGNNVYNAGSDCVSITDCWNGGTVAGNMLRNGTYGVISSGDTNGVVVGLNRILSADMGVSLTGSGNETVGNSTY